MTEIVKEKKLEQCMMCIKDTMLELIIDDGSNVYEQCCCSNCGFHYMRRQEWGHAERHFMSKKEIDRLHKRFSHFINREEQAQ